jgi:hypothetical protein
MDIANGVGDNLCGGERGSWRVRDLVMRIALMALSL